METPLTEHLTADDYEHVYEPAEDSFLLLDALEADLAYLDALAPSICVEIGSGSGIIITALSKRLNATLCLATDINMRACHATQRTAKHNKVSVDTMRCNLADSLRTHCVDLLLFNPPYVVTTDEEMQQQRFDIPKKDVDGKTERNIVYSWAGGTDGRRVTDLLLNQLDDILSPCGVLYLLLLHENKPQDIIEKLVSLQFNAKIFMERRIPGEYLYIMKVTRK